MLCAISCAIAAANDASSYARPGKFSPTSTRLPSAAALLLESTSSNRVGQAGTPVIEAASAGNLKRTWVNNGKQRDWLDREQSEGEEFLRYATEIKNIWIPYGE